MTATTMVNDTHRRTAAGVLLACLLLSALATEATAFAHSKKHKKPNKYVMWPAGVADEGSSGGASTHRGGSRIAGRRLLLERLTNNTPHTWSRPATNIPDSHV